MKKNRGVNKWKIATYIVLRIAVIAVLIRELYLGQWYNVLMCILTLTLFMAPSIMQKKLKVYLPTALEVIIVVFIFAADILGEIEEFYLKIPFWDTLLHVINGFLTAAIGFAMIDLLNRSEHVHFDLSPVFVSFVAFCFAMTIGVLWEFFEFTADHVIKTDMQKDTVVTEISSIYFNPEGRNSAVTISDISQVVITGEIDGEEKDIVVDGGYLELGVNDTVKDMFVNLIGAAFFAVIGYFYVKGRGKVAGAFIPIVEKDSDDSDNE